jgi:hypothetical protein
MILIISFESNRMMIFMIVKDEKPIDIFRSRCYILIEMFDLLNTNFIINPAVISDCNTPVRENFVEPKFLEISNSQNNKGW